jgi:hypothetical protein
VSLRDGPGATTGLRLAMLQDYLEKRTQGRTQRHPPAPGLTPSYASSVDSQGGASADGIQQHRTADQAEMRVCLGMVAQ